MLSVKTHITRLLILATVLMGITGCDGCGRESGVSDSTGIVPRHLSGAEPVKEAVVKIRWRYESFPEKVQLYDVSEEVRFDISQTKSVERIDDAPLNGEFPDTFRMDTGTSRSFALVIDNKSGSDLYFFATPHVIHPGEAAHRHRFECLCNSKVFKVPKGRVWYRIVRFDLEKDFDKPELEATHTIVGLSEKEVQSKYQKALYEPE
jgi:hypothetical protein